MLTGVQGALQAVGADWVNVQVGGIILQIFVPPSAIPALGPVGAPVSLHTVLRIQNEQPTLYGFPDPGAVELFGALTGVSGVSPRSALSILSELGDAGFRQAVAEEDIAALSRAQGIGRRIAQRIILELRGKLPQAGSDLAAGPPAAGADAEAVEALAALGMSLTDARQAIAALDLPADAAVEDKIRQALLNLGGA